MSERSPEYKSLHHCTSGLVHLLQHNLSLSGKLLEKGLVTEDNHGWILTAHGVSDGQKAEKLVSCITDSVRESADKFDILIEILTENKSYFGHIVKRLLDERERCTALQLSPTSGAIARGKEEVGRIIELLEGEFSNLQGEILSELTTSAKITAADLIDSLTSLPIALRNDFQSFIVGNLEALERVDSIRKVFHRLNPHFTFIDYGLLEHIINKFGSRQLKSGMSTYIEKIQIFINDTTVQELMDHWPGVIEIPPCFEELRAVIDGDPSMYTLRQLDDLRKRFCNVTLLSKTVLILIGIKRRSSFLLSWIIPSILLPRLKSVIGELSSFFHVEQICSLTHNGQQLYSMVEEYERRLLTLCDEGIVDEKEVLYLLSQPIVKLDLNTYDEYGRTSLWHACYHGRIDLVRILIEYGADVNLPTDDEFGDTALIKACDGGHVDVAALLIDKGARVDYTNKLGQHSLYFASFDGNLSIVRLLIQRRVNIDLPIDDDYCFTALGIACQEGHIDVARELIDSGVAVNYRNKLGATPLCIAYKCGHHDIFQLLLDNGATMDELSEVGTAAVPDNLLEKGLVTGDVHEWIQSASNTDKARRLVSRATDCIEESSDALQLSPAGGVGEVGETISVLETEFSNLHQRTLSELTTNNEVTPEGLIPESLYHEHDTFIRNNSNKTVQELMNQWPGLREMPPHFEELRALIDEDPSTYTLRQLDDLRKRFCNVTVISKTVLILFKIKRRGSFLLSWIIPSALLPHLKSVIGKLSSFFQDRRIYSLTHGGQRLYSEADEYEMKLLALCEEGTGDKNEVLYLLNKPEVNPNVYDESGRTSLWHATYYGNVDLARILLEHGADVNLPSNDEFGDTALIEACDGGHVDTAALLIEKGAVIDYKNKCGQHSLYFASYNGNLSIVHLLIECGAEIDLPTDDNYCFTALGITCQEGHIDVARELIDSGAAVNYQNKPGATPLYMASQCGHLGIVQLLLNCGACVDKPSKTGWTALLDASEEGHIEVVKNLIKHGAKLNSRNGEGKTALYLASWRGHADIARLLVEGGADTNICDQEGLTPLKVAIKYNHVEVVKVLEDAPRLVQH